MVFFSKLALEDIEQIFIGLLEWQTKENQQLRMTFNEVWDYRNDLYSVGNKLDTLFHNTKAQYEIHKKYGEYVYRYTRNQRTQWYFIYDKVDNDIFINKIISNYLTVS